MRTHYLGYRLFTLKKKSFHRYWTDQTTTFVVFKLKQIQPKFIINPLNVPLQYLQI